MHEVAVRNAGNVGGKVSLASYQGEGGDAVNIRGRVVGDVIEADVTDNGADPPCEHHWHLKKE
jgi:hypothetical protein